VIKTAKYRKKAARMGWGNAVSRQITKAFSMIQSAARCVSHLPSHIGTI
jgi:hypothetical protein